MTSNLSERNITKHLADMIFEILILPIHHFLVKLHVEAKVSEGHRFTGHHINCHKVLCFLLCHLRILVFILPAPITFFIPEIRIFTSKNCPMNTSIFQLTFLNVCTSHSISRSVRIKIKMARLGMCNWF